MICLAPGSLIWIQYFACSYITTSFDVFACASFKAIVSSGYEALCRHKDLAYSSPD